MAAREEAERQEACDRETRTLAPLAYRLSEMSGDEREHLRRSGEEAMDGTDLIRYFDGVRRARRAGETPSEEEGIYDAAVPDVTARAVMVPSEYSVRGRARVGCALLMERTRVKLGDIRKGWFDFSKPKTDGETRRFPLSAFAAVLAVAISLMLIVAGSVLLTRAESNISRLNVEIQQVSTEVNELRSDLEARHDHLRLREIATEEYGMIDEGYVRKSFVSVEAEEEIEAFEETRRGSVGLSSILYALGLKK